MKQNIFFLVLLVLVMLATAGCGSAATPAASSPSPEPSPSPQPAEPTVEAQAPADLPASPVVLTIQGPAQELAFTMEDLKGLPATSGQAGTKSSTGKITVPASFTGVLLTDLVDQAGGLTPDLGVSVVASDGYAMTLSNDQITNGDFIAYDPSDGSEKTVEDSLQVLVAYEMDGQPLDSRSDGNLRLVIISPKNNQVTDGHWSVKWVERIELQPLGREWALSLSGVLQESIDRNTFQSCGATSCHQSTWTDEEGQVWAGVPLYLLAGRMDDEITHEGPAYNRDLAEAGYLLELVAADGYTTTIDSQAVFYNRNILVANQVNDSPLPDKYFPLRLVGEDLEKGQQIGALVEIRLVLAQGSTPATPEPTPEPTQASQAAEEPPPGTTIWITGQVANPLALNDAGVRTLEVVRITAEHPKKGAGEYEGVYLNSLLSLTGPATGAASLVLTAGDGYQSSIDLAAALACSDCLLAFTESEGIYNLVMPGFESSAWVKNLVKIEVK